MSPRNPASGAPPARRRNAAATKEALKRAALEAFTRSGYDGVGLREIATAAGVDPRLVGRYFGSKAELFAETLELTTESRPMVPPVTDDAAAELLTRPRAENYLNGYLMTIRSTSNPEATAILREVIERSGTQSVAARLSGPHRDGRAALLIAINMGILLMRDILGTAALTDEEAEELVPYLEAAYEAIAGPQEAGTESND
ncbi:TetR family transcriptional regulator [Actinoallomurus bryophytorum]|uniref:TetR family transcriptional regulator n=1 Tax=Actinoallomurus bryophytorum TaxID=1490222 RepID=A0A543CJB0_9ACTN|nr:TetR/AcrR family transcriptional regulator [Actinoallomurus bryophytorum]TQL97165.1 TetR family transcriptional regulator [Actinoallomurus bryophytorum]